MKNILANLDNAALVDKGEISSLFLDKKIKNFHAACEYVWHLPYGRTTEPYDFKLVLLEGRGTCSSKHALLKLLADELNIGVALILGIYPMQESNTPGVGCILNETEFEYIPEAHCYLKHGGTRIDLTRYGLNAEEPIDVFFEEIEISPSELATNKNHIHRNYLSKRFGVNMLERVWNIRQACIEELST